MKVFFFLQQNNAFLPGHGKSHLYAWFKKTYFFVLVPEAHRFALYMGLPIPFTQGHHVSPVVIVFGKGRSARAVG